MSKKVEYLISILFTFKMNVNMNKLTLCIFRKLAVKKDVHKEKKNRRVYR